MWWTAPAPDNEDPRVIVVNESHQGATYASDNDRFGYRQERVQILWGGWIATGALAECGTTHSGEGHASYS